MARYEGFSAASSYASEPLYRAPAPMCSSRHHGGWHTPAFRLVAGGRAARRSSPSPAHSMPSEVCGPKHKGSLSAPEGKLCAALPRCFPHGALCLYKSACILDGRAPVGRVGLARSACSANNPQTIVDGKSAAVFADARPDHWLLWARWSALLACLLFMPAAGAEPWRHAAF